MSRPEVIRARVWLVVALAVSALVFTAWPEVDLWFSDLFRDPAEGFWLVTSPVLELWRDVVWNLSIIVFLMSLAGLAAALVGRQLLRVGARVWGFISLLYLLGPILLVNGLLKEHWGRARPANVTPLGGTQEFTPALIPTDVCDSNCSFVSGEGSAAVALGIAMLVLAGLDLGGLGNSRPDSRATHRHRPSFLVGFSLCHALHDGNRTLSLADPKRAEPSVPIGPQPADPRREVVLTTPATPPIRRAPELRAMRLRRGYQD
jgi:hypothetical protein